jgi:hypothetical protein
MVRETGVEGLIKSLHQKNQSLETAAAAERR